MLGFHVHILTLCSSYCYCDNKKEEKISLKKTISKNRQIGKPNKSNKQKCDT